MSVLDLDFIDAVSIDLNGNVVLTISDHLEWDEENEHLLILQNKINSYLSALESTNLYEEYPNAKGRHAIINIIAKYPPSKTGEIFLKRIKDALADAGYGFSFSVYSK